MPHRGREAWIGTAAWALLSACGGPVAQVPPLAVNQAGVAQRLAFSPAEPASKAEGKEPPAPESHPMEAPKPPELEKPNMERSGERVSFRPVPDGRENPPGDAALRTPSDELQVDRDWREHRSLAHAQGRERP